MCVSVLLIHFSKVDVVGLFIVVPAVCWLLLNYVFADFFYLKLSYMLQFWVCTYV